MVFGSSTDCGFISTQTAAENILQTYLCEQATLLLDAPLTTGKAELLKNAVLNQAIFAGQSLPPITEDMVEQMQNGNCPAVVRTLTEDITGTSTKDEYNDLVESGAVTDGVLEGGEAMKFMRLIFYGGATKEGDINSFYHASENVKKDYKEGTKISKKIISAQQIVDVIKNSDDSIIQSLDILSHGDQFGIYIYENKDPKQNSSLYVNAFWRGVRGDNLTQNSKLVEDIDFSKFTKNAKIEIHGCLSATNMFVMDNIAEELSEKLFDAGKTSAVVIAHSERASPLINGDDTKNEEQDYRWGKRVIFHNGGRLFETEKKGRITADEINKHLKN